LESSKASGFIFYFNFFVAELFLQQDLSVNPLADTSEESETLRSTPIDCADRGMKLKEQMQAM
jgi:hypothetical protein